MAANDWRFSGGAQRRPLQARVELPVSRLRLVFRVYGACSNASGAGGRGVNPDSGEDD
jgi:hypothetical protein